ncbi:MAG TPA: hypothetical protein VHR17_03850 [Thermoanaerobaculia bacterium]|nr:hypothetical protein [Thermoanaerobaculia bacterium]
MRRLSSLAAFLAIVLAAPVAAGTIINVERRELPDGTATPMVISVDGNLVSISDGGDERMIFRGDRQQMLIVDDEEKSYMALDAAMMEGVAQQLDAAAKQIEAAIANLPADQQAMARRLMEQQERQQPQQQPQVQRPAAAARAEATLADTEQVSRTAEAGTRHGYPCTRYEVFEEGVKVRELWVTDWDNVEGHAELEAAMKSMDDFLDKLTAFFGNLGGGGGSQMGTANAALAWHGIPGMPVVTTDFENGTATEESVVKSIDASSIPSSTFEVPEDYREEKIGG